MSDPVTTQPVNFGITGSAAWKMAAAFKGFKFEIDNDGYITAMPVVGFDPTGPASDGLIRPEQRVMIYDVNGNVIKSDANNVDGTAASAGYFCEYVKAFSMVFNGSTYDRQRSPSLTYKGTASGATPQNVTTAAGVGLKRRVFNIFASASAAGTLSFGDLTGITSLVTAGGAVNINLGPQGILQDTANTVITCVSSGGGTLTCAMIVSDGE